MLDQLLSISPTTLTLLVFLPTVTLAVVFGTIAIVAGIRYRKRLVQSGIHEIDRMSGEEFEVYCEELFKKLGYTVSHTGKTGDYGGDLIVEGSVPRTVVQVKRYKGRVGIDAVQQAVAAKGHYKAKRAMVLTNSRFTNAAFTLAKSNYVTLWGRKRLIDVILGMQEGKKGDTLFFPNTFRLQ